MSAAATASHTFTPNSIMPNNELQQVLPLAVPALRGKGEIVLLSLSARPHHGDFMYFNAVVATGFPHVDIPGFGGASRCPMSDSLTLPEGNSPPN